MSKAGGTVQPGNTAQPGTGKRVVKEPLAARPLMRLAVRSVRRYKARTALVVSLIGLPVAIALMVGMLVREATATNDEAAYWSDETQLIIPMYTDSRDQETFKADVDSVQQSLADTDHLRVAHGEVLLTAEGANLPSVVEVVAYDIDHRLASAALVMKKGDSPSRPGEVAISETLADRFGLSVGDDLGAEGFAEPQVVVGITHNRQRNDDLSILAAPGGGPEYLPEISWNLGQLDDDLTVTAPNLWARYRPSPGCWASGDAHTFAMERGIEPVVILANPIEDCYREQNQFENPVFVSALVGGAMLSLTGMLASAAFATGAKRRIHEYGMLSATGAGERQVIRLALSEALVLGVSGALLGILLALIVRAGLTLAVFQSVLNRDISLPVPGFEVLSVFLVGVCASLLAAYIPARTVARVPTQTALGGRIPLRTPAKWIAPAGIALFALGLLLLALAVGSTGGGSGDRAASAAVVGVVLGLGGVALLAGPAVVVAARLFTRFPIGWRLVARDAARQRTRTAAAVGALTVMFVIPVVALALVRSDEVQQESQVVSDDGAISTYGSEGRLIGVEYSVQAGITLLSDINQQAETSAAEANLDWFDGLHVPTDFVIWDRLMLPVSAHDVSHREYEELPGTVMFNEDGLNVWNDDVLAVLRVDEEKLTFDTLITQDFFFRESYGPGDPKSEVQLAGWKTADGETLVVKLMSASGLSYGSFISPQMAAKLVDVQRFVEGFAPLTEDLDQHDKDLLDNLQQLANSPVAREAGFDVPAFYYSEEYEELGAGSVRAIVFGLSTLACLLVVGVTAALVSTEVDHDLAAMVAIGAAPSTRRTLLARQTLFLAGLAAVLATPFGLVAARVLWEQNGYVSKFAVPWLDVAMLIGGVPIVCAVAVGLVMRSKPVTPMGGIGRHS